MDGIQYKVNITALVEDCRVTDSKGQESTRMSVESSGFAESKALHEKVRRMVLIQPAREALRPEEPTR